MFTIKMDIGLELHSNPNKIEIREDKRIFITIGNWSFQWIHNSIFNILFFLYPFMIANKNFRASNISVLLKNYYFSISYNTINCEPKDNAMRWYFPMHTICNLLCGHVCVKMIISTSHNRFCLLHHKHLVYLTVIERGRKTCLWKSQVRTLLMVFRYFFGKYYAISSIVNHGIHVWYINNMYVIQTPSSI